MVSYFKTQILKELGDLIGSLIQDLPTNLHARGCVDDRCRMRF